MTKAAGADRRATRRGVLKAGLAAGGAAALGVFSPPRVFARTAPRSGLEPVIVGDGDWRFECIHDWAKLPDSHAFGNTHGVCEDRQGRIYVKHTVHASSSSPDAVCVFDPEGAFITSWGAEFRGGAHGLHLDREGNEEFLYLCDFARHVVVKTDLSGRVVWRRGVPEESGLYDSPDEYRPTNVAVSPDGTVFVADGYGKGWIHRYTREGEYAGSFGGPGSSRGQLSCPHGLMVDTRWKGSGGRPALVVADRSNRRLQYFSLDGRVLGLVTAEMRLPCHFHQQDAAASVRGVLLVPDLEARVTLLDADNKLVAHLGDGWGPEGHVLRDKARAQFVPGRFIAPHSAIFDRRGDIFVVEWVEVGRVTKLRRA